MAIRELTLLVSGKRLRGPLTNGHVIRPMAWYYWPNNPLAVGVEHLSNKLLQEKTLRLQKQAI